MDALIQSLTECEALLRKIGEAFWADKFRRVLQRGAISQTGYSIEEVLTWYGGMGSFNDLFISKYNGHSVEGETEKALNNELNRLRSAIYQQAKQVLRD